MITIGIDPHKDTHTAAAVDDATGQLLDELTVPGTDAGHQRLLAWAHELGDEHRPRFALEDCRHVNGRLERFLVAAGQDGAAGRHADDRQGPPERPHLRQVGLDRRPRSRPRRPARARSAASKPRPRAGRAEAPGRPPEDLVSERMAIVSRLRWHLHDLDSGLEPFARTLNRETTRRGLSQRLGYRKAERGPPPGRPDAGTRAPTGSRLPGQEAR